MASRVVLNSSADGPHELRTDAKTVCYPERYSDQRGAEIWGQVIDLLAQERDRQSRREETAA